jgi:hypothetical protein
MSMDEDRKSKFNAGVALAERIDALQQAINGARFNPLAPNMETGRFNFEIMVSANDSLLNECWAKLNPTEKNKGDRVRKVVMMFLRMNPPITRVNSELRVNKKNYENLMEILDIYEKMNKDFLDAHDLNAPNKEDDDDGL